MSAIQPGSIFKGVTPGALRRVLGTLIESRHADFDFFLNPCAGFFAMIETLAGVGVPPEKIHACDITLFSATLGSLFDPDRSPVDLAFEPLSPELKQLCAGLPSTEKVDVAATILLCLKFQQLRAKRDYIRWQKLEMISQKAKLHENMVAGLSGMAVRLTGMHFSLVDAHDLVEPYRENPKAWIWYNPPGYSGGYEKQFPNAGEYSWAEPKAEQLTMDRVNVFLKSALEWPAFVTVLREAFYDLPEASSWTTYHCDLMGRKQRKVYIIGNRKIPETYVTRRRPLEPMEKPYPTYSDDEIRPDTKIQMIPVTKDVALYYYDLVVRKLGITEAKNYYAFVIDGKVAGTVGFDPHWVIVKRLPHLWEVFGLTIPSARYPRLNRLLMRYITSQHFIDQYTAEHLNQNLMSPPITELRTTCLSQYPEVKINRGILKLVTREKLPNDCYRLVYHGDIHKLSPSEVVAEWLAKHSEVSK